MQPQTGSSIPARLETPGAQRLSTAIPLVALLCVVLPWLNPGSPPLVPAFDCHAHRRAGQAFEHNGVGGLIARGHFESLLLPAATTTDYNAAGLARHRRDQEIGAFAIHRRIDMLSP